MHHKESPYQVTEKVASSKKYTLFQDFNHNDPANFVYFYSKENIDALAKAGKKHMVSEFSEDCQSMIDKLAAGKMSKADFVQKMSDTQLIEQQTPSERHKTFSTMADGILYAKEKGIKVHAVDKAGDYLMVAPIITGFANDPTSVETYIPSGKMKNLTVKELVEYMDDSNFKSSALAVMKLGLPPETKISSDEFTNAMIKAIEIERVGNDKGLANRIIKVTHGEDAAIMYGASHGSTHNGKTGRDLDEYFGDNNVAKIGLTPHLKDYHKANKKMGFTETPETLIITDSAFFKDNTPKVEFSTPVKSGKEPAEHSYNELSPQVKQLVHSKELGLGNKLTSHDISHESAHATKNAALVATAKMPSTSQNGLA